MHGIPSKRGGGHCCWWFLYIYIYIYNFFLHFEFGALWCNPSPIVHPLLNVVNQGRQSSSMVFYSLSKAKVTPSFKIVFPKCFPMPKTHMLPILNLKLSSPLS